MQELSHQNIIGVSHVYIHIKLWCAVVDYMLILTSVNLFSISAPGCFWTQIQHQSCLWFHGDRSRGDNNALAHVFLFIVTPTTNLSQSKAIKNYSRSNKSITHQHSISMLLIPPNCLVIALKKLYISSCIMVCFRWL